MEKILIAYASITGNTRTVAEHLNSKLSKILGSNFEFTLKDMLEIKPEDFSNYNKFIFGSSTWSDGDLNPSAEDFFSRLDPNLNLSGKTFYLFGLGESFYPHFCTSVEKTAEILKSKGATINENYLKIDGEINQENLVKAEEWAGSLFKQ